MSKKMTSTAFAALGAAALSGLIAGTANASSNMSASPLLLKHNSQSMELASGAAADAATPASDKHDCKGKNDCKGKGGCKSGDNGCKGKNSCKGKGGCNTKGDAHAEGATH